MNIFTPRNLDIIRSVVAGYLTKIKEITEFNIGHFIIGESIVYGLKNTIKKFKKISNKSK